MVAALHLAEDFYATDPWAGMGLKRYGPWTNATTDIELADMARARVTTFWHPCCTARMGKSDDDTAVVDSKLKLKGAEGVRIVDASVFVSTTFRLPAMRLSSSHVSAIHPCRPPPSSRICDCGTCRRHRPCSVRELRRSRQGYLVTCPVTRSLHFSWGICVVQARSG